MVGQPAKFICKTLSSIHVGGLNCVSYRHESYSLSAFGYSVHRRSLKLDQDHTHVTITQVVHDAEVVGPMDGTRSHDARNRH